IFGSELKALMAHPLLSREVDPCAVEEYFAFGYVPDPRTIYRQAFKLAPGHTLSAARGAGLSAARQYWDVSFARGPITPVEDAAEELVDRLREAVRCRLVADVPLGAFLSGGVDSSAVVAMMAELSSKPVTTCSIAFEEARYDESAYAAVVADRYATR